MRFILLLIILFPPWLNAATYYVSSAGNDTNAGTSKAASWAHAPGMQNCASVCSSTTINGGDQIIFRGGDTWGNSSFMWSLKGGSSGSPVYYGVDKTWYSGASWTQPIFDAGGTGITNNADTMFSVPAYVTMDDFEITGFYWDATVCSGAAFGQCGIFNAGQTSGQTFENLYIHGWTHAGTDHTSTAGVSTIFGFGGNGQGSVHDCVILGTDVSGDHSMTVFFNGPGTAYNNYIQQVSSAAIISYAVSFHDNYIDDVGPAYCNEPFPTYAGTCTHENGFEDNGDLGLDVYNNVITNIGAGLALWIAPNPTYSVYVWNNVIYGVHDNQVLDIAPPVYTSTYCSAGATGNNYCLKSGNYYIWNNTIQCGDDTTQYSGCNSSVGVVGSGAQANLVDFENNFIVSTTTTSSCAASGSGGALTCTFAASNVVLLQAAANADGYTSSQTYAFSPTSGSSPTVGTGSNLTSSATGNLASLASDTTYACTQSGAAVVCPARTTLGRAATGAWDSGAYQYGSAPVSSPGSDPALLLMGENALPQRNLYDFK